MLGQLLLNAVRVGFGFIHFIDCDNNLYLGNFGVVDSLDSLRHNTVVCGNNQDSNIGSHSTTLTHRSKCGVSRSIKEGNLITFVVYAVSTDVLSNTACLTLCNFCITDSVEQRGFTVVNVTHNNNNGTTGFQGFLGILRNIHNSFFNCNNYSLFNLASHFGCNDFGSIIVNSLVNGCHHTEFHQLLDNLGSGFLHSGSKFTNCNLLTDSNGNRSLFNLFQLKSAKFICLGFTLCALRTAIVLRLLFDFLFTLSIIVAHCICRCNVLITLVIFININVRSTGVNLTDFNRSTIRCFALLFLFRSGWNINRLRRFLFLFGFNLGFRLLFLLRFCLYLRFCFLFRLCLFLIRLFFFCLNCRGFLYFLFRCFCLFLSSLLSGLSSFELL